MRILQGSSRSYLGLVASLLLTNTLALPQSPGGPRELSERTRQDGLEARSDKPSNNVSDSDAFLSFLGSANMTTFINTTMTNYSSSPDSSSPSSSSMVWDSDLDSGSVPEFNPYPPRNYAYTCWGYSRFEWVNPSKCFHLYTELMRFPDHRDLFTEATAIPGTDDCLIYLQPLINRRPAPSLNITREGLAAVIEGVQSRCQARYGKGGFYEPSMRGGDVWRISITGGNIPTKKDGDDTWPSYGGNPEGLAMKNGSSSDGSSSAGVASQGNVDGEDSGSQAGNGTVSPTTLVATSRPPATSLSLHGFAGGVVTGLPETS